MSRTASITCGLWILAAMVSAGIGAWRGMQAGRWPQARARLTRPTLPLFAAYLLIAAWVTPRAPGESASPLLGLGLLLPVAQAAATFASIGTVRRPSPLVALLFALLHGGAVLASAAIVLALASPAFVPPWLR